MATYKGIQGYSVQTLASDPSPTENVVGQLWYNSTSGTYKIAIEGAGAWSSGGNLNIARSEFGGGRQGTLTAGIVFGGDAPPSTTPPGYMDQTEEYNGSAWTEVNNLNNVRASPGSLGTQTAAMCISGNHPAPPNPNYDEVYDGTSWTEVAEINTWRTNPGGAGTTTAATIAGGNPPGGQAKTETWNGTSWTEVAALNTGRSEPGFAGTVSTAAMVSGGNPGYKDITEQWNGTSWSETNQLTTARGQFKGSFGSQTAAIVAGGITASPNVYSALTEIWNGSSWSETGDIGSPTRLGAGGGSSSSGFCAGGRSDAAAYTNATDEWADPVYAIKTVTTS